MEAHRVVMTGPGGPDVLRTETYDVGAPGPREALLRQTAIGLNYIDIQHRTGRYPLPQYPSPIGLEAAGVVEAIGAEVREVAVGDRMAYSSGPIGAYADLRLMPADRLIPLPPEIPETVAAAIVTKGLTAHYLLFTTYIVRPGDIVLVHAAAGGVGVLLCQWARHLGATVIGTVGSDAKAEIARAHGCQHVIIHSRGDFAAEVRRLTGGKGVPVVYDAVGKDTFEGSLRSLAPRGLLVSFGTPSGAIPPFDVFRLNTLGSLSVTSPAFVTHTTDRGELLARATAVFSAVGCGILKLPPIGRYPLAEAARAHAHSAAERRDLRGFPAGGADPAAGLLRPRDGAGLSDDGSPRSRSRAADHRGPGARLAGPRLGAKKPTPASGSRRPRARGRERRAGIPRSRHARRSSPCRAGRVRRRKRGCCDSARGAHRCRQD
jgi:NADPH2:quinone reductase